MLKYLEENAVLFIVLGIVIPAAIRLFGWLPFSGNMQGLGISISQILFLLGCIGIASKKGYHWALGFLGLLSCIGLLILLLLPERGYRY